MAIAALFDIDGTLIARNSAPLYMRHLRRSGQVRRRDVARTLYYLARYKVGMLDIERALIGPLVVDLGPRRKPTSSPTVPDWYAREVRALPRTGDGGHASRRIVAPAT